MGAVVLAIICAVAFYGIAIAQLPAPLWDRLGPHVYHAVTVINVVVFMLGLLSCAIAAILGSWMQRLAIALVVMAYLPMVPTVFEWIVRRAVHS